MFANAGSKGKTMNLDRRRFVAGAGGAVLALPWLESLAHGQSAERPIRLVVMYHSQGLVRGRWAPATNGGFGSGRISEILEPLDPVKDRVAVFSGIGNPARHTRGGDNHRRSNTTILTNVRPQNDNLAGGPSIEQVASQYIRAETPRRSILLPASASTHGPNVFFSQDGRGNVTPVTRLSWNPRAAAETLFGSINSEEPPERTFADRLLGRKRSLVDSVSENLRALRQDLPAEDRARLDAHAEHVHSLRERLDPAQSITPITCSAPNFNEVPNYDRTVGQGRVDNVTAPAQIDNLVRAFSCDLTRVACLYFNEGHDPRFPWLYGGDTAGVIQGQNGTRYNNWHHMIHDGQSRNPSNNDPGVRNLIRAQQFYAEMYARLLQQLAATEDFDGRNMLDNTLVLWMTEFGHENHGTNEIPVLMGGLDDRLNPGRHVRNEGRAVGDVHNTVLSLLGAPSDTTFGLTGSIRWSDLSDTWAYSNPRPASYSSGRLI